MTPSAISTVAPTNAIVARFIFNQGQATQGDAHQRGGDDDRRRDLQAGHDRVSPGLARTFPSAARWPQPKRKAALSTTDAPRAAQPQLARGEQAEANELSSRITRINPDKSRDWIVPIRVDEASCLVAKTRGWKPRPLNDPDRLKAEISTLDFTDRHGLKTNGSFLSAFIRVIRGLCTRSVAHSR